MAVAVKTPPGASSAGPLASPAILSLVGVVYLLACLVIVFKVIPDLWWGAVDAAGYSAFTFVGGSLLAILSVVAGIFLLLLGSRLLSPNPPVGIRAGVFVGFVGFLLVVLLARWASLWMEYWSYHVRLFTPSTGMILTIVVSLGLLAAWLRFFTLPSTQRFIVKLEEMGWFHATTYKPNQGLTVRRSTIAGLLMIVGAGIYTLISNNTLSRGPRDWSIDLPFTGKVAVENYGDAFSFIADQPESAKSHVQIRWPGVDNPDLRVGQTVSFDKYRAIVERIMKGDGNEPSLVPQWEEVSRVTEPTAFLMAVNKQVIGARLEQMLNSRYFGEGVTNRLRTRFEQTTWEDLGDLISDFYREAESVVRDRGERPGSQFYIPSAVLLLDRYVLRSINDDLDESKNVKILFKKDSRFEEGQIVSREVFDGELARLEEEKLVKQRDREMPEKTPLIQALGPVKYDSLTVLPSVQFTVPLLLLAGSLWLAWRVVNMPTFADFLIATEAEMNKVSWTTQKRLFQDTVVVLITTLLMAVFLFGMDLAWKQVLSFKYVGVLYIPKDDQAQKNKPTEQKRW